jgi:hypothetical protein
MIRGLIKAVKWDKYQIFDYAFWSFCNNNLIKAIQISIIIIFLDFSFKLFQV